MRTNVKNSSGKIVGYTEIKEDKVLIQSYQKPVLILTDFKDISRIKKKDLSSDFLLYLYDHYLLTCGEIASLYDVCYSNINRRIKRLPTTTSAQQGRRNRSYGMHQKDRTKEKISQKIRDAYDRGCFKNIDYSRDTQYRKKISEGTKRYAKNHPEPHRRNWANGVYANVDFKRGIAGHFFSYKNNKDIFFRSLLELYFMLQLEEDKTVNSYQYESLRVPCDNGTTCTPDILVNKEVIELKSYKFIHSSQEILDKVIYKKNQCEKYCSQHNLSYKIIYDKDIGFDSSRFKRELQNHPELITRYNIRFNQPERIVIK